MPPFYMMPAVPSTFSQYGAPTIIQIPSNTHTGSTTTQFPGPPKIPYGQTSTYYDSMSQVKLRYTPPSGGFVCDVRPYCMSRLICTEPIIFSRRTIKRATERGLKGRRKRGPIPLAPPPTRDLNSATKIIWAKSVE